MKKYKIKKGTVMETLLIPLYGKMKGAELFPDLFKDEECVKIFSKIDYDFKEPFRLKMKIGAIMASVRQFDLASVCRAYLNEHERAAVVNLGCGLDTTFSQINNGKAKGYNIDFAEVIEIRNKLIDKKKNEENLAADINDLTWIKKIDFDEKKGIVFFASGVFYYFKKEDVKKIIVKLAESFPRGKIVFDATNPKGLKKMLKTWLKPNEMVNIGLYFSIENEQEILQWSDKIKSVKSKGYMAGYMPLNRKYGVLANLLFKHVDRKKLGQIIEIDF